MTERRTRRRPPRTSSALAGMKLGEKPQDRLNAAAPHITRCAWPRCTNQLQVPMPGGAMDRRFGVLCATHAADVAIAVIQDERDANRVKQFFAQQTTKQAVRGAEWRAEDERYEAEKAALRQDRDGFVYYLQVGERIKVGYSVDVKRRMRSYPPGCQLLAVEPGDRDLETQRHRQTYGEPRRFAHHYRRNEQPMRIRPAS